MPLCRWPIHELRYCKEDFGIFRFPSATEKRIIVYAVQGRKEVVMSFKWELQHFRFTFSRGTTL